MTLPLALTIVARKKPIVALGLVLAIVTMVATLLSNGVSLVESSSKLAGRVIGERVKLTPATTCDGSCTRLCMVKLYTGGGVLRVPLAIIPQSKEWGGVKAGYWLSRELNVSKGDNITFTLNGRNYHVRVVGVYRGGSLLDTGLIASNGYSDCNETMYTRVSEGVGGFTEAFSRQVGSLIGGWWIASLTVLALGSVIASLKAYIDLGVEAQALSEVGRDPSMLRYGLALFFSFSVVAGYAWGLIASDTLNDLVATYTGVYIPLETPSSKLLLTQVIIPALIVGLVALLVGARFAPSQGENNP